MEQSDDKKNECLVPRPPVVVVMGHIDHGKTSLLDFIRNTKVTLQESGNITQHIGAYEIEIPLSQDKSLPAETRKITFLDTPGHEAFATLRSRGAQVADIAILIIAADEGVMPQTKEALYHIKAAGIPFIVAINKIDKPNANPEKVKNELSELGVFLEGRGGDVPCVEISAKTGENVDELLELILLLADLNNFQANKLAPAQGVVLESHLDNKRGITATLLIKNGTFHLGDKIYTSNTQGKIKIIENFLGKPINEASFSSPVIVVGFEDLPLPGSLFICAESLDEDAKKILFENHPEAALSWKNKIINEGQEKIIPILIKGDCIGSCEALIFALESLAQELGISFLILDNRTGNVTDWDLKAIDPKTAIIIAFRTKIDPGLNNFIKEQAIKIVQGETIYEILDGLKAILSGEKESQAMLKSQVNILAIFHPIQGHPLIGGEIVTGIINVGDQFKVIRQDQEIGTGTVLNIQSQKQNVKSLGAPNEAGFLVDSRINFEVGDRLEIWD